MSDGRAVATSRASSETNRYQPGTWRHIIPETSVEPLREQEDHSVCDADLRGGRPGVQRNLIVQLGSTFARPVPPECVRSFADGVEGHLIRQTDQLFAELGHRGERLKGVVVGVPVTFQRGIFKVQRVVPQVHRVLPSQKPGRKVRKLDENASLRTRNSPKTATTCLRRPTRRIKTPINLLEEGLAAGAFGFTTSRTAKHRAADGRPTPSLTAEHAELAGLALAMKRAGTGVIQVNSDFGAGEFPLLRAVAEPAKRPLSVLLVQMAIAPGRWAETLASVDQASADGLEVTAQVGSRPIGILLGLEASQHPFLTHPLWHQLQALDHETRIGRLTNDGELRGRLVEERPDDDHTREMATILERTFELGDPLNYEPEFEASVANRARAASRDPFDLALELLLQEGGRTLLMHTFENYCDGDLNVVYRMLANRNTVCGIADGGAHVGLICDSSSPTSLLTHWARDRMRGPQLPLEFLVHKQTAATARTYGLHDRGVIAPGYRADLNVIDFTELHLERPIVVHDLPAGGKRIVQRSKGYRHTFVHGIEVAHDGEDTGARPGRLLRGFRSGPGGRSLGASRLEPGDRSGLENCED